MRMSKEKFLKLVKQNLYEMAMDFETPDRPDPSLQSKLAQGDTPLKKVPLPKTGEEPNKNFQEILASQRYKQVIDNLRRYLGVNAPVQRGMTGVMQLQGILLNAHNTIVQIENQHKEELEQLAVELVMKEMGIPEGAVEFDAKIVGMGEIDSTDFNRDDENQQNQPEVEIENEIEIFNELKNLDLEKAKRRMVNSIIQGASKRGHYMFQLVPERLQQITGNNNILNLYGTLMSINDITYWQLTDEQIKGVSSNVAGKESVERPEDEDGVAKVVARGINFPVLVHELIKGVLELFAIQGRPEDEEGYEEVEKSEDTLEKEVWDLRLGPAIWDRIRSSFPDRILEDEEKKELQNYILTGIFKLPAREFLVFVKEVISGSNNGKRLMDRFVRGIEEMLNNQDYEESLESFNDELKRESDQIDDDDLYGFLDDLGIDRPKDN